jgi:hypothetical protein
MKTKNLQSSQEEKHRPSFLTCETSHKKFENPQNDKKKIEDFGTLKYQHKSPLKFPEEKQIPHLPPCETSHKHIGDPPNDKKKIEDSGISKYKNKKLSKFK